jgi:hypothetical protein
LPPYEEYCLLGCDVVYKFTDISDERVAYTFTLKPEAAAQDRDQWRVLVNTVINLRFP